jgi:glucan phosphoethanolaminetransferase (alkaline phosphatase superfamily)
MTNFLPLNVIKQTSSYWLKKSTFVEKRIDIAKQYKYTLDIKSQDLNVILIIGESAREDHFSLGGYKRNTNPWLSKEKNLIYYREVTACYPLTRVAVPCMLTRATRDNKDIAAKETSFIGIFRKLGFYTSWVGMQGALSVIDAPYIDLAKESHKTLLPGTEVELSSSNDSSLLKFVEQFSHDHIKGENLLVLHTFGSHFHYEDRYPSEFREFKPVCFKKKFLSSMSHCSLEELNNSYDNSILYTDYFIKQVIDRFRDKNTLVIYTSDHGESLGENGRFLHGTYNAGEQVEVPIIFWASDKYIKNYPENFKKLKSLKTKAILHDHLFHTILGCSGIKSEIVDKTLNLCDTSSNN